MYDDIIIEQRVHDLAVQATISYFQQHNISIDESSAWDYATKYRSLLSPIRRCLEEGRSDLR